jgi:hypothetical protein
MFFFLCAVLYVCGDEGGNSGYRDGKFDLSLPTRSIHATYIYIYVDYSRGLIDIYIEREVVWGYMYVRCYCYQVFVGCVVLCF